VIVAARQDDQVALAQPGDVAVDHQVALPFGDDVDSRSPAWLNPSANGEPSSIQR
jgi:hypothetical protein